MATPRRRRPFSSSPAARERAELCALALSLGPSEPTVCTGWTVKDLVVHLLVRERKPNPTRMMIDDRALACVVCGGGTVTRRSVTVITSGAANTGLNKVADAVTCHSCGFLHHFVAGMGRPVDED